MKKATRADGFCRDEFSSEYKKNPSRAFLPSTGSNNFKMAPRVGFEPTTLRLTAGCSAVELPRNLPISCALSERARKYYTHLINRRKTQFQLF